MRASISVLLEAAYAAWAARDLPAVLRVFSRDVVFVIHLPEDIVPFAGEVHGRDQLAPRLQAVMDEFDFIEYTPLQITAEGEVLHSRVRFHYVHKETGLEYEGRMRHTWSIEGDQVVRWEEFHDAERVRAFFKLLAQRKAQGGSPSKF